MKSALCSLWLMGAACALSACESDPGGAEPSRVELLVEAPEATMLARIGYELRGEDGRSRSGELRVTGLGSANAAEDGERTLIWRASLELPASAYSLQLIARTDAGQALCTNENAFVAFGDVTTEVYHLFTCDELSDREDRTGDAIVWVQGPGTANFRADVACGERLEDVRSFLATDVSLITRRPVDFGLGPISTNVRRAQLSDLPTGPCRIDVSKVPESSDPTCTASFEFTVSAEAPTPVSLVLPCSE